MVMRLFGISHSDMAKVNLIGVYLLAFMAAFVAIPVYVYFSEWGTVFARSMVYISSSAGLGGVMYCFRGFHMHLSYYKDFDLGWTWWYVFTPFLSILVGVFVYFLIAGGIMSIGVISPADYSRGIMFYCGVSFLAGFSFRKAMAKMKDVAGALFATSEENLKKE